MYVPLAGGNNGIACVGRPAEMCFVQTGQAACSYAIERYSIVELTGNARLKLEERGLPYWFTCRDRGSDAVGVDIAIVSNDIQDDLVFAFDFGKMRNFVKVWDKLDWEVEMERREYMERINQ